MEQLHALARAIGIAREWRDVEGREQTVADASLALIATALGYPAHTPDEIAESLIRRAREEDEPPAMIVTDTGVRTPLPASLRSATLTAEDGLSTELDLSGWSLPPIDEPGYYTLRLGDRTVTLAVAPQRCPTPDKRIWGPAVQIPALPSSYSGQSDNTQSGSAQFGTFAQLAEAVRLFAARGANAVAINPVHALFPGWGRNFSPYSPSSRLYRNGAMGDPVLVGLPALEWDDVPGTSDAPTHSSDTLIDWENALPRNLMALRRAFANLAPTIRARVAADNAPLGEGLYRHAIYDALDCRFRPQGARGWQDWPAAYHDPESEEVATFARENAAEVEFHLFVQWLARQSQKAVQNEARNAGMSIGLLADLAVGVHTGGADSWSMRDVLLQGLTIGAPPDPLGPHGQNWMVTGFSPLGLARSGYAPWIATIRAALDGAGALRIDHAYGLARLWVVPEGHASSAGAYLTYPFADLMRLVALEAHRADAVIVAEDLGTAPPGFTAAITERGMLGMRVLWFERAADDGFIGAQDYEAQAVAMTGTHDTATVAGWWTARDLDWAERLDRLPEGTGRADAETRREWDRGLLWATLTHDAHPRPTPQAPSPVIDAALRHIGRSPSLLAIAPLEDLLGEIEQPNLPGTVTEHPNWRRQLSAPLSDLLLQPEVSRRIQTLDDERPEEHD